MIDFLEGCAVDQDDSGFDYLYGAGRMHLGDPSEQTFGLLINNELTIVTICAGKEIR